MTTQTRTRSKKADDKQGVTEPEIVESGQGQQTDSREPEPSSLPKPAEHDLGRYLYPMFRPVVTGPDGVKHSCPHRDGHGETADRKNASAWACLRAVTRKAGLDDSGMFPA